MNILEKLQKHGPVICSDMNVMDVIEKKFLGPNRQTDAFCVLNIADVLGKLTNWKRKMPRIKPFYAVKCNTSIHLLTVLAMTDIGFDCASLEEIKTMISLGVDPSRIVYANPCKQMSHLEYASTVDVNLMTFDNEHELLKIRKIMPNARLLLRIRCDAVRASYKIGNKFGAEFNQIWSLLETAKNLKLDFVGVAFHVGNQCLEPSAFSRAIKAAKEVFNQATSLGFHPKLLDLGGGFPGTADSLFDECTSDINSAINEHFPISSEVKIIAEPGTHIAYSAFTVAAQIIAKRENKSEGKINSVFYYINVGKHSTFRYSMEDKNIIEHPIVIQRSNDNFVLPSTNFEPTCNDKSNDNNIMLPSTIFGPTCDGTDTLIEKFPLPLMEIEDWIVWKNMGAYTLSTATTFNSFPIPIVHTIISKSSVKILECYQKQC